VLRQLPFNHLENDSEFNYAIVDDLSLYYSNVNLGMELRLDLFSNADDSRSLLNNPDLDPDTNYFAYRPSECCYATSSNLKSKFLSKPGSLSLMHVNCRSIVNKLPDLKSLLDLLPVDILAVTETWLSNDTSDQVKLPGYDFKFVCRQSDRWGGVGLFLGANIRSEPMVPLGDSFPHTSYESLFTRCYLPNGSYFIIGVIYRPPGLDLEQFNADFHQLSTYLSSLNKDIYLLGDFNIDLLKSQTHTLTGAFMDSLTSNHLIPLITKPTRITPTTSTLIDNILVNSISKVLSTAILASDISDHLPVMAWIDLTSPSRCSPITTSTRIFNDVSVSKFKSMIDAIDWRPVQDLCLLNDPQYDNFFSLFKTAYDSAFPPVHSSTGSHRKFKNPWMTSGLLKSSKIKEKLYIKYIKNPTLKNKQVFTTYRNKFKSLRIKAECNYYESQFLLYHDDLRKTWRIIRSLIDTNHREDGVNAICVGGVTITDHGMIAEKFNNYFAGIAQSLVDKLPPSSGSFDKFLQPRTAHSIAILPTSSAELIDISHSLKPTHSAGLDDINPWIMKSIIDHIASPLALIFNSSLSTGIVPQPLKMAKVVPIHKQGDRKTISNYRPISILPYFSKLLEKVMYTRLYDFILKGGCIYPYQHGFQSGHSTAMSLLTIQDNITNAIDNNEYSIGIC